MRDYQRSILQQKAKGTYDRNQKIVFLYKCGVLTNMAEIGLIYKISRQAVWNIVKREERYFLSKYSSRKKPQQV